MTINPIRPPGTSGPSGPTGPQDPGAIRPAQSAEPGSVAFGQQLVQGAGQHAPKNPLDRATYDRISRRIREAATSGKTLQETLGLVVEDELTTTLGQKPSPSLLASVCEQFQTSPQLKDLFGKLHRKALG